MSHYCFIPDWLTRILKEVVLFANHPTQPEADPGDCCVHYPHSAVFLNLHSYPPSTRPDKPFSDPLVLPVKKPLEVVSSHIDNEEGLPSFLVLLICLRRREKPSLFGTTALLYDQGAGLKERKKRVSLSACG